MREKLLPVLARIFFFATACAWLATVPLLLQGSQEKKQQKKEEEEDPVKVKKKSPILVGDENPSTGQEARDSITPRTVDFATEAGQTRNLFLRDIYQAMAAPFDLVLERRREPIRVAPLKHLKQQAEERVFEATILDDKGKETRKTRIAWNSVESIDTYELIGLEKVKRFLERKLENEKPTASTYMPRLSQLLAAERILSTLVAFHESAVASLRREGAEWEDIGQKLRDALKAVQMDQLRVLASQDWNSAFDHGGVLASRYPKDPDLQAEVVRLLTKGIAQAMQDKQPREAGQRLMKMSLAFPNSRELDGLRSSMKQQADSILSEVRKLEASNDLPGARSKLEAARDIYPQLPGLHDYLLRLDKNYQVLRVQMRDAPQQISPARAVLDSEKQCLNLVFESLVRIANGPDGGQRFERVLAEDRPSLLPLGRGFQILRNAYWSDGKRQVSAVDVRLTVAYLSDPAHRRMPTEWIEMMRDGATIPDDAFQIDLTMRKGILDPLALMDFKILPQEVIEQADSLEFARHPIGSGPYLVDSKPNASEGALFSANPYFSQRAGKSGRPFIREVAVMPFDNKRDLARDLRDGSVHMMIDIPTSVYRSLKSEAAAEAKVLTLPSRRIYFLAVNHRQGKLANADFRRAIAYSINRESILNDHFRIPGEKLHRSLAGPYPPQSWAAKPGLISLDNESQAKVKLAQAKEAKALLGRLSLKYPQNSPDAAQACLMIQKQAAAVGIDIDLQPTSPYALHRDVEETHDYDLAYYYYDYANESYSLWSLFDPDVRDRGGRNYLGFSGDAELDSLFRKVLAHRDIAVVKGLMHQIQDVFAERMPFIPLWQLDYHVAYSNRLRIPGELDPMSIFAHVDEWILEGSAGRN